MTQTNAAARLPQGLTVLYVEDVAPLLRQSEHTVRGMARAGQLGFRKAGRRYVTTLAAVEVYLRSFAPDKP